VAVELKKVSDWEWELLRSGDMRVPGWIFASEEIIRPLLDVKERPNDHLRGEYPPGNPHVPGPEKLPFPIAHLL
ncbi:MAG: hypothetical protein DRI26_04010, partial [Chloroflexi bacterium]